MAFVRDARSTFAFAADDRTVHRPRVVTVALLAGAGGLLLALVVLRDITHTLLDPAGRGDVSWWIMRLVWATWRRIARGKPERLSRAGPLVMLTVIGVWCVALILAWAIVYWPHMPSGFDIADDIPFEKRSGLLTALYFSMVCISTVGFGDITPTLTSLRLLAGLESIVGFALLTASITWVLSAFPVLTRQRSLAHAVLLLQREEEERATSALDVGEQQASSLLETLTEQMVVAESDLAHSPVVYFFTEREDRASLALAVPYVLELARRGMAPEHPRSVRHSASMLHRAVRDFAETLRRDFLPDAPDGVDGVLEAYARDHLR